MKKTLMSVWACRRLTRERLKLRECWLSSFDWAQDDIRFEIFCQSELVEDWRKNTWNWENVDCHTSTLRLTQGRLAQDDIRFEIFCQSEPACPELVEDWHFLQNQVFFILIDKKHYFLDNPFSNWWNNDFLIDFLDFLRLIVEKL